MRNDSGGGSDSGDGVNGRFNTRWLDEVVTQVKVNEVCNWAMEQEVTGKIEAFLAEISKKDKT